MTTLVRLLVRLRVQQEWLVDEVQALRSGRVHPFDRLGDLWRFLLGRLPGPR